MFWRRQTHPAEEKCGKEIFEFLVAGLRDKDGRIRAEEIISAAASVVGERCIAAAGDFNPRNHTFAPGSRVFSDKVNELLCGDSADTESAAIPAQSVYGQLRDRLVGNKYNLAELPSLKAIFQHFAANVGKQGDWGRVPLSVPADNHPYLLPLRTAYETRKYIDGMLAPLGDDHTAALKATTLALAETLIAVADVMDHKVALTLAFETINGMSKTAPMTDAAMAELTKKPAPAPEKVE